MKREIYRQHHINPKKHNMEQKQYIRGSTGGGGDILTSLKEHLNIIYELEK